MPRPASNEYAPDFGRYIQLVPEEDVLAALETQLAETVGLLRPVPESVGNQRQPPYTWSIKEVVGHLTDTERILAYRALRFGRGDTTPLPGFDQNPYVPAAEFDRLALGQLVSEFETVRRSHLYLFRVLPGAAWSRGGEANGHYITVRALAYTIVGHGRHHTAILHRRLAQA